MSSDLELNFFERLSVQVKRVTGLGAPPDFLIIGGMKCASTALYWNLTQHPLVYPARKKEVHYFSTRHHKGWKWYTSNFPSRLTVASHRVLRKQRLVLGEASPYYIFHPYAPLRIKQELPQARLVALLRHPVHRAYSHFQHNKRRGIETFEFEEALAREDERMAAEREATKGDDALRHTAFKHFTYKARGRYVEQLKTWFEHFPREQLLIIQSEQYQDQPVETMARVCAHLGLPAWDGFEHKQRNVGGYDNTILPATYAELTAYFEPYNQALYELLGVDYGWK